METTDAEPVGELVSSVGVAHPAAGPLPRAGDEQHRSERREHVVGQRRPDIAAEEGVRVTSSVSDEVEATLTAGLVDPEAARAVRSGLLVRSLKATGVDAVDAAAAVALPSALGFAASPTAAVALLQGYLDARR